MLIAAYTRYQGATVKYIDKILHFYKATAYPNLNPPYIRYDYTTEQDIRRLAKELPDRKPDDLPIHFII